MNLRIRGSGIDLRIKGRMDVNGLEGVIAAVNNPSGAQASPAARPRRAGNAGQKPKLTPQVGYRYLARGKDFDWFNERYECTKGQVAAYRAWITMRGGNG